MYFYYTILHINCCLTLAPNFEEAKKYAKCTIMRYWTRELLNIGLLLAIGKG